jgi:hypothetical protein
MMTLMALVIALIVVDDAVIMALMLCSSGAIADTVDGARHMLMVILMVVLMSMLN